MEGGRKNVIKNMSSRVSKGSVKVNKKVMSSILSIKSSVAYIALADNVTLYAEVLDENMVLIGYVSGVRAYDIEVFLVVNANLLKCRQVVYISDRKLSVKFGSSSLGCVVNVFGDLELSLCEIEDFVPEAEAEIFGKAVGISQRDHLNDQLVTGFNSIDLLYPTGYGQRMLIVGDKRTYKTTIVSNMIKNASINAEILGRDKDTIFVYASVGQRKVDVCRFIKYIIENDIASNTIIVSATSSAPLGIQFIAPYAAMSIAEFFAKQGKNVCLFIDDITKHAIAHREMCLLANRLPGRESFQGDIFYMHSSLLERSAKYIGGGSITCFPVVETINEEIASYIPTNVVSITDGQIFCSKGMLDSSIVPPVHTGISVSRTGSSVQLKFMKSVMGRCKKILSIHRSLIDLYKMYGNDCDADVKSKIRDGVIVQKMLYDVCPSSIDIIRQMICVVLLQDFSWTKNVSLSFVESSKFTDKVKEIIESSFSEVSENEDLVKKISSSLHDQEVTSLISSTVKKSCNLIFVD